MPRVPNTLRRQGIFYFRRVVPDDLRLLFPFRELVRSLKTADVADARRLSRCCYLLSEELFAIARSSPAPTSTDIARMVRAFYADVLEEENRRRLVGGSPISEERRRARARYWAEIADRARKDLAANKLDSARQTASHYLAMNGFTAPLSETECRRVQQAFLRAGSELAEALRARFEGDFNFQPRDDLLIAELEGSAQSHGLTVAEAKHDPTSVGTTRPAGNEAPLLSRRCDEFRDAQVRRKVWEKQTAFQARKTYQLFVEHAGDRPLDRYRRIDATRFRDLLLDLPADYGKAAIYKGKKASEIVTLVAQSRNVGRVSSRTVQRHISVLSALWKDAIDREEVSSNIFEGFTFKSERRSLDQREMWPSADLARLFVSPLYTGCFSASRRSRPGNKIIRDEKFWLPLIAVFSAMRQEEICQLHVDDVREEGGVWVFDINARGNRQLKNENAVRLVPIHEELERIGFLSYVQEQRAAQKTLLFHQLTPGGADQRMGHNFSKWFTRYRRDTNLYKPNLDFHSFRHSATTFLGRAGVQRVVIAAIVGHSVPGETSRYSKGYEAKTLKEAIDRLDPQVDLSHLYETANC